MADRDLTDDAKFILGEIYGVVKAMPSRMDRFEAQVTSSLTVLNNRLAAVETVQAHQTGIKQTLVWFIGGVSGVIGSMLSGLLTYFAVKH